jgi:transcriptional regulator with XRE-family HTH domain
MENNINEVIRSKGYTKKFVCESLGINQCVMSLFIGGVRVPSQDRLKKMAKFLGVKVTDLYPQAKAKRTTIYELN